MLLYVSVTCSCMLGLDSCVAGQVIFSADFVLLLLSCALGLCIKIYEG